MMIFFISGDCFVINKIYFKIQQIWNVKGKNYYLLSLSHISSYFIIDEFICYEENSGDRNILFCYLNQENYFVTS